MPKPRYKPQRPEPKKLNKELRLGNITVTKDAAEEFARIANRTERTSLEYAPRFDLTDNVLTNVRNVYQRPVEIILNKTISSPNPKLLHSLIAAIKDLKYFAYNPKTRSLDRELYNHLINELYRKLKDFPIKIKIGKFVLDEKNIFNIPARDLFLELWESDSIDSEHFSGNAMQNIEFDNDEKLLFDKFKNYFLEIGDFEKHKQAFDEYVQRLRLKQREKNSFNSNFFLHSHSKSIPPSIIDIDIAITGDQKLGILYGRSKIPGKEEIFVIDSSISHENLIRLYKIRLNYCETELRKRLGRDLTDEAIEIRSRLLELKRKIMKMYTKREITKDEFTQYANLINMPNSSFGFSQLRIINL